MKLDLPVDPRVLLVESDPQFAYLVFEALSDSSEVYEIDIASNLREATQKVEAGAYEVIVVDLHGASARTSAPTLRRLFHAAGAPVLVVSNRCDHAEATAAIEAGAEGYLVKAVDGPEGIVRAIRVALERQRVRAQLERQAFRDPLTGLHNRASFLAALDRAIQGAGETGRIAVLFTDLDGFKQINDGFGHSMGDVVLQRLGQRMRAQIHSQLIARLGGDEFALLVDPIASLERTLEVAEGVVQAVEAPLRVGSEEFRLGCRVGVALRPLSGLTAHELLVGADAAMYAAKRGGGTIRVHLPDGMPQWGSNVPSELSEPPHGEGSAQS